MTALTDHTYGMQSRENVGLVCFITPRPRSGRNGVIRSFAERTEIDSEF